MIIAWTYLLHAFYRSKKKDYRYYEIKGKRKKYDTTRRGAQKYWDLERCLSEPSCPLDRHVKNNLLFPINIRHEIEHQMTMSLDNYLSGRYQACVLNFNRALKELFGNKNSIERSLTYSLQFSQLSEEQLTGGIKFDDIPERLRAYIAEFDSSLSEEEYNHPDYSYRLVFTKKLVNRPGQADKVVEFVNSNSEIAKTIEKEFWVKKEVERPKYRATEVVEEVRKRGYPNFRMQPDHTIFWKKDDAKNPGKGYGVSIQGYWYWYDSWIDRCAELCESEGDKYRTRT